MGCSGMVPERLPHIQKISSEAQRKKLHVALKTLSTRYIISAIIVVNL